MPDHDCISTRGCFVVIRNFFYFVARRYSLIFLGQNSCARLLLATLKWGRGCSTRKKIQALWTKFWVRSFVEKSVPPTRGV